MHFDDEKDQGSPEPQPADAASRPNDALASAENPATERAQDYPAPATPSIPAAPSAPATPSPWQPLPPTASGGSADLPSWAIVQPTPQASSAWPPQPQPPTWQAGVAWQPQARWGAAPAGMYAPRRSSRLPLLMSVAAVGLLAFSGGLLTDRFGFAASPTGSNPSTSPQSDALYNEAVQVIKQNFVGRADLTDQQLTYGSIAGLVDSLGDTGHSEFLTAAEYAAMQSELNSSSIAGIGVILSDDNGAYKVDRVLDNTPAAGAGIEAGDEITAVNGTSTANMSFDDLATAIRGEPGTSVTLTVIHLGSSTPVDVTMVRATITVPLAEWGMVPGTHIADISLAEFSSGAADQVQSDITAATTAGATAIVLDLRGNPGGYADEAQEVASEFLSSGTVYIEQDANGNDTDYSVDAKRAHTTLPMVVLVDHDSASSAEIVTGALQDAGRARIVGVNTYGTGTVLEPFKLSDGSVIILGTSWWLTPDGHRIFGVGITPDQKVSLQGTAQPTDPTALSTMTTAQFSASTDSQLIAAVNDLSQ